MAFSTLSVYRVSLILILSYRRPSLPVPGLVLTVSTLHSTGVWKHHPESCRPRRRVQALAGPVRFLSPFCPTMQASTLTLQEQNRNRYPCHPLNTYAPTSPKMGRARISAWARGSLRHGGRRDGILDHSSRVAVKEGTESNAVPKARNCGTVSERRGKCKDRHDAPVAKGRSVNGR